MKLFPDYCHLIIKAGPTDAIYFIVNRLQEYASFELFNRVRVVKNSVVAIVSSFLLYVIN